MEKKYNLILSIPITSKRDDKLNMLTQVYELLKDNPFHVNIVDALISLNNCIYNGMSIGHVTISLEKEAFVAPAKDELSECLMDNSNKEK